MDRDAPAIENRDLVRVDVQAQHVVAHFGEARTGHQADVTGTNDGDSHATSWLSSSSLRLGGNDSHVWHPGHCQ